jgi:hypothetical protein
MKSKSEKAPRGRPSKFSPELGAEICGRLAGGESLYSICKSDHMPDIVTVYRWMVKDEDFRQQYARAREDQAETHADQMQEIADEMPPLDANGRTDSGWVQWQRNRIDTRKWIAAKLKPKKYGDKVDLNHGGGISLTVSTGIPDEQTPD